ncbi:MAG: hypothetical protein HQ513_01600 [Rhodospirillales bacterium]|nr:hypothetical protein [Rhodospirillales bacterium]
MLKWKQETASLRSAACPEPTKTVLFCDLLTMVATAKVEALFAKFLALRGYRVVVLFRSRNRHMERLFASVSNVEFVRLDTFDEVQAGQSTKQILDEFNTFDRFLSFEIDGVRVGKNVLSWVVRQLRVGSVDFNDPDHRRLVEETLVQSLNALATAKAMLDLVKPNLTIFVERGYTPAGEVFDLCIERGVDVVQWVGAPASGAFLFKRYNKKNRAFHPLSLSVDTWDVLKTLEWDEGLDGLLMEKLESNYRSGAWFNRQKLQENKWVKSRDEVFSQLGLDPSKKVAVIFSHILYDATFFYGNSLFADYAKWLIETVRLAIANPNLNWLIKVHPVNVWRSAADGVPMEQLEEAVLREAFGQLPDHVKIIPADTDINTYSFFNAIDYGLTVRGTVGMELPCYGIPTVTAGSGRYSGAGFTVDPQTVQEYRNVLADLHSRPPLTKDEVNLAHRYAFGSFYLRPKPIDFFRLDFHADDYGLPLFAQNTYVKNTSGAKKDMNDIADWMAEGRDIDLLDWDGVPAELLSEAYQSLT